MNQFSNEFKLIHEIIENNIKYNLIKYEQYFIIKKFQFDMKIKINTKEENLWNKHDIKKLLY